MQPKNRRVSFRSHSPLFYKFESNNGKLVYITEPVLIAKSNVILDVKPWDDETDMKKMEEEVRKIATEGLLWGAAKLIPLAFGIHKLSISCVVEDDKVSIDWLIEEIEKNEDIVQSVDVAAFNKI